MIIAVSDVHLGEMGFQKQDKQFSNFLDHVQNTLLKDGGDLVLLGDIFDFWRRDSVEILEDYGDIIEKVKSFPSNINVHYIIGNHDYYMSEIPQYFDEMPFSSFGLSLRIKDVQTFRFIHGHQLEVMTNPYTKDMSLYLSLARRLSYHAGVTGSAASGIWNVLTSLTQLEGKYISSMLIDPLSRLNGENQGEKRIQALSKSKARQFILGGKFDWLVFGHTHHPFNDNASKTTNTGSWGRDRDRNEMCYLKIENGMPKPMIWSP
jgi:UDP-2,3-diacylglucosamine pyrophosphatase LpxH